MTIQEGRSGAGTYWCCSLVPIGGTIFVVAAVATDMFGLKP